MPASLIVGRIRYFYLWSSMECCNSHDGVDQRSKHSLKIIRHPLYQPKSSPWFDLRVFYVRVSNFEVEDSTPEHLTLNYIPLGPNTILEVNGGRSTAYLECVISQLRRDRVDKNSEEVTFVNTDSIKMTGSVRFEVHDRDDLLLSGFLELCDGNGFIGEAKNHGKKWNIKCKPHMSVTRGLLKGNQYIGPEVLLPTLEVYVAGCFSGSPIILTKTLQLSSPRKTPRKVALDSIPESESSDLDKTDVSSDALETSAIKDYKQQESYDYDYNNSYYQMADYMEGEDGELSWFNAGVRVGVGLGLGICVGVGLGVGLLVHTYQAASRNFKRRLL